MKTKDEIIAEKIRRLKKKMVSNARAILTNQISLELGVQKMTGLFYLLKNLERPSFNIHVLDTYYNEIRNLPFGPERLHWNADALRVEDAKLQKSKEIYNTSILKKCEEIIEELSKL